MVSVIIPTYNRAKYLGEAIDSVLNQTYQDFEIIVVDDGSTDNTKDFLESYAVRYPQKIRCFHQENKGVAAARNKGIKESKGEYVAFLDSDDEWLPLKLEKQISVLSNNESLGMVHCTMKLKNNGEITNDIKPIKPAINLYDLFICGKNIISSSVLIKKSCLDVVGPFDESLEIAEDYDLWLRIFRNWKVGYTNEPLAIYNQHFNNISKNEELMLKNGIKICKKLLNFADIPRTLTKKKLSYKYYLLANFYHKNHQDKKAVSTITNALITFPLVGLNLCLDKETLLGVSMKVIKPYIVFSYLLLNCLRRQKSNTREMREKNYKILFVHGNSDIIAGQELSLLERIASLKQVGVECEVLVPEKGVFSDLLKDKNILIQFIKLNRFTKKKPLPYLKTVFDIFRLIKKEGISIVHTSGVYPTQYCLPAARLAQVPCITNVNQTLYSKWDLRTSFVQFVDAVVCISEAVKITVINSIRIPQEKVFVSYNGIGKDILPINEEKKKILRYKLNIGDDTKIVGQVGQIIPRKGLEYFIKMARIVKNHYSEVRFIIIGMSAPGYEGYEDNLKKMTEDLGLTRDIIFTGFKPPKEAYELLNLFDVSVLASLEEGLGRIIFESSALGKPVVGTNIDSISEAVLDNHTGLTVPPKSSQALAQAVLYLLKNPDKAQEFGENGKKFVLKRFSMNDHRDFLINLYASLFNKKSQRKILFYEASSGCSGSSSALVHMIRNLNKDKFIPITVFKNYGSQIEKIKDTEIIRLKDYTEPGRLSNLKFLFYFAKNIIPEVFKLYFIIKEKSISLVHVNINITAGIPAIIASKIAGVPCVCHIRETRKLIKREKIFVKWVNKFILLNKCAYELYKTEIPEENLKVIYDGIGLDNFTKHANDSFRREYNLDSMSTVGVIGRVVGGKGQKEFILAAKEVLKERPDIKFFVVGEAKNDDGNYYKEVKELAIRERLENRIVFTGWRNDIANIIEGLDIVVLPSTTYPEGLPNAIIEAMALKKPVMATDIPGPRDIVVNDETGLLVLPGDIKAMAENIIYLIDNPDIARKMGEAGRKRAEELFDIKKQAKEIEKIYLEVLS